MAIFHQLPDSVLQLLAVFLSIIIEALPFVLLGSILSGFIEVFVTPEKVQNFLPKNKVLAILFGTLIGFIFPSCECGIVPIITRFLEKKVPSYTAIPFMATAPIINPVVLFATYTAFGNSWYYVLFRFVGAFLIAMILASQTFFFFVLTRLPNILKQGFQPAFSALTFPTIITATSLKMAQGILKLPFLDYLILAETAICLIILVFVLGAYLNWLRKKV